MSFTLLRLKIFEALWLVVDPGGNPTSCVSQRAHRTAGQFECEAFDLGE